MDRHQRLRIRAWSFNPRPARVGGATRASDSHCAHVRRFQSAPRPRGRGDTELVASAGMPASQFQSAPRPRGRGDSRNPAIVLTPVTSFNPRPAHVGGATVDAGIAA